MLKQNGWISTCGLFFAGMLLAFVAGTHLKSSFENTFFIPVSPVEEMAYTYTAANNFLTYGYLNSGLLQDFSTSSDAADHPYVYTHMPPGPEISTAFLLQISGGSYFFTRTVFAFLFVLGMFFYFRFAEIILRKAELRGAGFVLLFVGPFVLWEHMERLIYSPWPLLCFVPLIALQDYYRTKRTIFLWLMGVAAFLNALYLEYFFLSAICFSWLLLFGLRIVEIRLKHLMLFAGMVLAGVLVHMIQNFLFMGPELFFNELKLVLSNRIFGVPTKQELVTFYQTHGIVHHGTRELAWKGWLGQLQRVFVFPMWLHVLGAAVFCGLGMLILPNWNEKRKIFQPLIYILKVWGWIAGVLIFPMLLFPSFAQEYTLRNAGISFYFLGIGGILVMGMLLGQLILVFKLGKENSKSFLPRKIVFGLVAAVILIFFGVEAVGKNFSRCKRVVKICEKNQNAPLMDLQKFAGHVFMTNVNSPTVGFLVREAGFAVCPPEAISEEGKIDVKKCPIAFVKQRDRRENIRPKYFFRFWDSRFFPGFAEYSPSGSIAARRGMETLRRRLASNFPLIYKNEVFEVYDLHGSRSDGNKN